MATSKASVIVLCWAAAACAGTNSRPLSAETATGTAGGPVGKVLVVSTNCGSMESVCRNGWSDSVDGIVVGDLEFHGYATIDPASLRKDEATRTESTVADDTTTDHDSTIDYDPTTDYQLNYRLSTRLPTSTRLLTSTRLPTSTRLLTTDSTTDYRLPTTDSRLPTTPVREEVINRGRHN